MTTKRVSPAVVGSLAVLFWGGPALPHHSYAMFQMTEMKIEGTVKDFEWTNPHVFIEVMTDGAGGSTTEWSIEATGPGQLSRQGWKFSSLKPGDKVKVALAPLRNGTTGGGLIYLLKADGTRLDGGPLARLDPDPSQSQQPPHP